MLAIVRDITAQRELEAQLHQSEKLTALGQIAGGIAHDFNNLLQAILGYAQLMEQNLANAEVVGRCARRHRGGGHRTAPRRSAASRSSRACGPTSPSSRWTSTRSCTTRWRSRARAGRKKIARDGRPLELGSTSGRYRVRHGPPGRAQRGHHQPDPERHGRDARRRHADASRTRARGRRTWCFTVTDTGIGMSEDVRRRIFDPFFSTKGEGARVSGLSMVLLDRGAARRRDPRGQRPGRGHHLHRSSCRSGTEPRAADVPAEAEPARAARGASSLVDNDLAGRSSILGEMLGDAGHHVVPVAERAPRPSRVFVPGGFDLVITNIGMAGDERLGRRRAAPRARSERAG